MGWTEEQQKAIDFRNGNLLVSAAAGSGKTAVLVERIIKRVTDTENPIGVDSVVVVTFTRAAAEEMKTRLGRALEKLAEDNPDNRHIIKQLSLIDSARITTIDSFCTYILRNYYNTIGLDPAFRVADGGELSLMRSDVFKKVAETEFADGGRDFIEFAECFAPGKVIDRLEELVLGLYDFAQSNPWPDEWLDQCLAVYQVESADEYEQLPIVKDTAEYIRAICRECADEYKTVLRLCDEALGPACYKDTVLEELRLFEEAAQADSLQELERALSFDFGRLPAARGADAGIKERVKTIRDAVKKRREVICEKYLADASHQYEKLRLCRVHAGVLIRITKRFAEAFKNAKTAKNIMDFSDIEHYALDILIEKKEGRIIYTETADELSSLYDEIYIDEYQDSNLVQEYILGAVSKERFGEPDTFMVGDVKQSIYKFRMAKPELFMHKYDTYAPDGEKFARVELHKNFRSRANVLACINDVFFMAMKKSVGGVEYTKEVQLNYKGGEEEEYDDATEILIADKSEADEVGAQSVEVYAHMAAGRIKSLMSAGCGLSYRDIVILLRSDKKTGPVYASVLKSYDIPCVYESSTGYFDAYEVKCVMDFLRIIDNPRQEIALAGVMHSYFAYFTAKELALIKGKKRRTEFYDCVVSYAERDDGLAAKCRDFLSRLSEYREKADTATIRELLSQIIYKTGYYDYVGTMGAAQLRRANLDMLVQKAKEFEQTSYSGLFNFLRYVEKIQKYDVDYGDAQTVSGTDDVVRIMSIHKSKGLEFPVVILGGAAQKYNLRDVSENLIYDSTFGIGMSLVDLKRRVREEIPYKQMLARRMTCDSIGEELRILYVAMTRAAKKLIILGISGGKTANSRWEKVCDIGHMNMSYITENRSYLDIVMPCTMQPVKNGRFIVSCIPFDSILENAMEPVGERSGSFCEVIENFMNGECADALYGEVKEIFGYQYPYKNVLSLRTKYSVSDLKHRAMEENGDLEVPVVLPDSVKPVPCFIKEPQSVSGTLRGNAYHKVFELLDYSAADDAYSVELQIDRWVRDGRIGAEYRELVDCRKFEEFMASPLGMSMKAASAKGLLYREQPFAMEIGANIIDAACPSEEKVLVQGIIDAFYFEGGKVFVVDYKTDSVPSGVKGEELLRARYAKQLELYCDAIQKVTGKEIGGCFIYSVNMGKALEV